jgi:hypothetical protein
MKEFGRASGRGCSEPPVVTHKGEAVTDVEDPGARTTLKPSRGRLWIGVNFATSLAAVAIAAIAAFWTQRSVDALRQELDSSTDELAWAQEVHSSYHDANKISADVGAIQFLDNGFSVHLEKVNHTTNGLELAGYVGNPTNLWVSQLTLEFRAYRPLASKREEFMEKAHDNRWFFLPDLIGHAQAPPIALLAPGRREAFLVTIPNVNQSQGESFELRVNFKGERYSYGS